ncbi:hypothetical protein O3M35_003867 [Rhynocoris fuscipes]|uniref:ER-bound oxygenase mpaB/mpaB'/Rubber oxygenase catalytic domain-containing protein n=1 Tax=Rhynocoris fuscipes TaxID=488301 RepID=A0AAW1CGH3_9HEMI
MQAANDQCKSQEKSENRYNVNSNICCQNDVCSVSRGIERANYILDQGGDVPMETGPPLLPSWYDHQLICKGQQYFTDNIFAMFVAALSGLTVLLSVPSILKILRNTNRSSKPASAYKRYYETIVHMMHWYQSDMRNPNSKGRQSVAIVRKMHENAVKNVGPITQKDLALTQFGFIGMAIVAQDKLGLPKDNRSLIHFWRVMGHLMGIQDKFNLFSGCERCTIVACKELSRRIFIPGIDQPIEHYNSMCSALLTGMWPLVPAMNPEAYFEFTRRLLDCPARKLSIIPTISLYSQIFIHYLIKLPIISLILLPWLNFQIWLTLFVQNTIPILAFYAFRYSWRGDV